MEEPWTHHPVYQRWSRLGWGYEKSSLPSQKIVLLERPVVQATDHKVAFPGRVPPFLPLATVASRPHSQPFLHSVSPLLAYPIVLSRPQVLTERLADCKGQAGLGQGLKLRSRVGWGGDGCRSLGVAKETIHLAEVMGLV